MYKKVINTILLMLSGLKDKAHGRSLEMARSNMGLNKSTYHLREVNRSTVLHGFCLDEIEPTLNHAALAGTVEEVRVRLNIPEGTDMALIADLLIKKEAAINIVKDARALIFYDQQACQVIQVKNLEYMKAYRGTAGLHESSVRRIETTDRAKTRLAAAETREKKSENKGAGGGGGKSPAPSTSGGKSGGKPYSKPYSKPNPGGRDFIATYGGPNNCRTCFGPSHLGYACPPLKK
jgi:hypothetical protein